MIELINKKIFVNYFLNDFLNSNDKKKCNIDITKLKIDSALDYSSYKKYSDFAKLSLKYYFESNINKLLIRDLEDDYYIIQHLFKSKSFYYKIDQYDALLLFIDTINNFTCDLILKGLYLITDDYDPSKIFDLKNGNRTM